MQVNSSDTDRTIALALALTHGPYPLTEVNGTCTEPTIAGHTLVPIHTTPAQHDVAVRAYEKCPTHNKALIDLYNLTAFKEYDQQQAPFFASLLVSNYKKFCRFALKSSLNDHCVSCAWWHRR
jgi:hypothetical protein